MSVFDRILAYLPSARTCLIVALGGLMMLSLLMVASASIPYAMNRHLADLKFFWSQLGYMSIAIAVGAMVYQVPLKYHFNHNVLLGIFVFTVLLLFSTLLFGQSINGSKRWLSLFGFSFQPAELAKVFLVMVVAEFMHRRSSELRYRSILLAGTRLMVWYIPILIALYLQPDYGSIMVIGATMLVMLFVGGAPLGQFALLTVFLGLLAAAGLWQAEYRQARLMSFVDPFDDVLDSDYQLSRSLIAFGRGEFSGVGYGNSVQKLAHLPEAHTDFLLAITGEELGFLGVAAVIILEFIIIIAMLRISYKALVRRQLKLSYMVFGFCVIIFGQVCINAGMNMGMLPTKGLTLPFFSYGGSSMLFSVIMIAIALKVNQQSPMIAKAGENREY